MPTIGSFAGSEMVMLSADKGKAKVASYGVALSRATIQCEGSIPLCAIEERALQSFAGLCPDDSKVGVTVTDKQVTLRCKKMDLDIPFKAGEVYEVVSTEGTVGLAIGEDVAKKTAYLSQLAFSDSSRPELCCVMLSGKKIISCSPKAFGVLSSGTDLVDRAPVPIPFAKELKEGDVLYAGKKTTVLVSGIGTYAIPTQIKALKDFPIAVIEKYGAAKRTSICALSGTKLGGMLTACSTILGGMAKTDVILSMETKEARLHLSAQNGSARFHESIQLKKMDSAVSFSLPMDEMKAAIELLQGDIGLQQGPGGEIFISLSADEWLMLPPWKKG